MKMKKILALILALVMVLSMVACGSSDDASDASDSAEVVVPTTLTVGLSSEPASLDPQNTGFNAGISMSGMFIYDTLLSWNAETGTVEPNVITEWNWVDDLTLNIKIRDDIVSHDGYAITTEDIAYMFERGCATPGLARYYSGFDAENCEIISATEMNIAMKTPSPAALTNMTLISFAVQSKQGFEAAGGADVVATTAPSATGLYVVEEWLKGDHITLKRNENYWGEPAPYETVTIKYLTDASSRLMALQSGDVDVIDRIAASEATLIENDANLKLYELENVQNLYGVYLNCANAPLNDAKVRQAMSMAVNREALLQSVFFGRGQVADGIFAKSFPMYSAPKADEAFAYDVEAAKALLADAGYADGFTITMITSQTQAYIDIAQFCQAAWSPLGIKVDIQSSDSATFFSNKNAGAYDAYVLAATGVNYVNIMKDYDNRLTYERSGATQFNPSNESEFHAAVDTLYTSLDQGVAKDAAAVAQSYCRTEFPSISLVNSHSLFASKTSVAGITMTCMGESNFSHVHPAQ